MSMCFVCLSWTGLDPMKIDPMLSPQMGTVPKGKPNSSKRDFIHMICQHVSDNAMYSASVDERVTFFLQSRLPAYNAAC